MTGIPVNLGLRQALRLVQEFGGTVTPLNRTGESLVAMPGVDRRQRVSVRRKDCPRRLLSMLRQEERRRIGTNRPNWAVIPL